MLCMGNFENIKEVIERRKSKKERHCNCHKNNTANYKQSVNSDHLEG